MTSDSELTLFDRDLDCLSDDPDPRTVHAVRPDGLERLFARLLPAQAAFLRVGGFAGAAGDLRLLPGQDGVAGAVLGLGTEGGPFAFGVLPAGLPATLAWRLEPGDYEMADGVLGFCLGSYRYAALPPTDGEPRLAGLVVADAGTPALRQALSAARAAWLVRDLINTPANLLGPSELADAVLLVGQRFGAGVERIEGPALAAAYPAIEAVGRGSARPPMVAVLRWSGSRAGADAPLISLCGKGVVFDTGGYDIKPSSGMLRMKKDMGGGAILLGLARMIMQADLPVRLALRVGCVENSISGAAMRPSDVLRTRRGLSVEVGNTDAEGRLVLADLLAEASDEQPALLVDAATLTGAARVALGPDLPALFSNDDEVAAALLAAGEAASDPLWRLPLASAYAGWLASPVADLCNVASKPMAGAVTAALFLQRFVAEGVRWIHIDVYAWNDGNRAGRPEGGEAQTMRALFDTLPIVSLVKDLV